MKKVKFWIECLKIAWNARTERNCRQKYKRLAREFDRKAREIGLNE